MIFQLGKSIFVHLPKTGGNFLARTFQRYSDDMIQTSGHQDGLERFGLTGEITKKKHQHVAEYVKLLGGDLRGWTIFSVVRQPFERLVSLYFSPHQWLNPDRTVPDEIFFDGGRFAHLIGRMPTQLGMLNARGVGTPLMIGKPATHKSGAQIKLFDFANLPGAVTFLAKSYDFDLGDMPSENDNASVDAEKMRSVVETNAEALEIFENSRHVTDKSLFPPEVSHG